MAGPSEFEGTDAGAVSDFGDDGPSSYIGVPSRSGTGTLGIICTERDPIGVGWAITASIGELCEFSEFAAGDSSSYTDVLSDPAFETGEYSS